MALRIQHLTKRYRRGPLANDDITLTVTPGEVYGLLGHNGAGKTTLLNQIVGLAKPTSGTVHLDGHDLVAAPALARRLCSIQPQSQLALGAVSPRKAIQLLGRIRGGGKAEVHARTEELLDALDMTEWADTPGEKLSGGLRRLAGFCVAAVAPGRVVMLDEPTNDVDPVRRQHLRAQIRALADAGSAVLLVTHDVAEAERGVDRLAVLGGGRVLAEGTPAELRTTSAGDLRLEVVRGHRAGPLAMPAALTGAGARAVAGDARRQVFQLPAAVAGDAVSWAQTQRDHAVIEEFALMPISLEDVYRQLVGDGTDTTEEHTDDRAA